MRRIRRKLYYLMIMLFAFTLTGCLPVPAKTETEVSEAIRDEIRLELG